MPCKNIIIILEQNFTARAVPPDPVHVSKKAHEEICWTCPQGSARIQFTTNGSPFQADQFIVPYGGSVCTGPVTGGEAGRVYKYSIVGHMKGNPDRDYSQDPEVEVDQ